MMNDKNVMMIAAGILFVAIAIGLKMYKPKKADKTVDTDKAKTFGKVAIGLALAGVAVGGFGAYKKYGHLMKKSSSFASDLASPSFDF